MIDRIINNGRHGEELEKSQAEARGTTPEKKPSIREQLEDAKRECAERKSPDKPAPQKKPGAGRLMSWSKKWRLPFFLGENGRRQYNKLCKGCVHPCKQSFRAVVVTCPHYLSLRSKK